MIEVIIAFLFDNAVVLGSIASALTIVEVIFAPFRSLALRWRKPEVVTIANPEAFAPKLPEASGDIRLSVESFTALQRQLRDEARADLAAAHGAEKQRLEEKIDALNARLANPDEALAQQQAIITDLEAKLARQGNTLGGDDVAQARAALEQGDFTAARKLFETLSARTAPDVQTHAEAEFALGQIAEADIRWLDAAAHYARAADLNLTYGTLRKASDFAERAGDYAAALRFSAALVDHCTKSESLERQANALNEQAINLRQSGRFAEAEKVFNQALEIDRKTIGTDHPDYATGLNNLAGVVQAQGRLAEAEGLYGQALEIGRKTIGTDHPDYATRLNNLAGVVQDQGRLAEAEGLYAQALEIDRKTIGTDHPGYATDLNNLALVVQAQGRLAEAEGLYTQALEIDRNTIGADHPDYAKHLNNLAMVVEAQGRWAEARDHFRTAVAIRRARLGDGHPSTQHGAYNLLDLLINHFPDDPDIPMLRVIAAPLLAAAAPTGLPPTPPS